MFKSVLIIEDDKEIAVNLRDLFIQKGIDAYSVQDGRNLDRLLKSQSFDLVILDLMLPYTNGAQLCQEIKASKNIPIIMISALKDPHEKVNALELGADDFLDKPVHVEEIIVRANNIIKRRLSQNFNKQFAVSYYQFSDWLLDVNRMKLETATGVSVALSKQLYDILILFLTHPKEVLTRDFIASSLHNGQLHDNYDRSIDVAVSKLRKRLQASDGMEFIQTQHGKGYYFNAEVSTIEEVEKTENTENTENT